MDNLSLLFTKCIDALKEYLSLEFTLFGNSATFGQFLLFAMISSIVIWVARRYMSHGE